MTTDLKNTTPREARLGRWVLVYGILQVLSTLSVDVQALKHTDGVRYFLCTDLKRCPEWVTNGQIEYLEASQKRSWCWQRSWDPAPTQTAPVELEATPSHDRALTPPNAEFQSHSAMRPERERDTANQPPPLALDGATLMQNDIHRINEKINSLSLSQPARQTIAQEYECRRENEKSIQSDFGDWKPRFDSLPQPPAPTPATLHRQPNRYNPNPNFPTTEFDFIQPLPRPRSPLQRETMASMNTDLAGYPFSPEGTQWPVPPGYNESNRDHRESGIGYSVNGSVYGREGLVGGNAYLDVSEDRRTDMNAADRRSPRRVYERGGWN
jgi:FtsZ-binding cell division protein ZapB